MKKAVFFDIDGTIISDDDKHIIPDSARKAIKQLKNNNILTFINTGRTAFNVDENIRELGFTGYLCGCGTYIEIDKKEVFYKTIAKERCLEIVDLVRKCNACPLYERKDDFYFDTTTRDLLGMEMLRQIYVEQGKNVSNTTENDDFSFDKFVIWYDDETDMKQFMQNIENDFDFINRGKGFAEIVPKGCSKATAIYQVCKMFDIDIENTYAIGDSLNDLPMVEAVAHSACIGKDSLLAEHAQYVADDFYKDGLASSLKFFGLTD
jgi:hypothetical protein